jgi:hypothetical protein
MNVAGVRRFESIGGKRATGNEIAGCSKVRGYRERSMCAEIDA